jgi:hypothetical protein
MALEIPERFFRNEFNPSFPLGVISEQEDYVIVTPIDVFQSNKGKLHYRKKVAWAFYAAWMSACG